jgi:hypothetical protein
VQPVPADLLGVCRSLRGKAVTLVAGVPPQFHMPHERVLPRCGVVMLALPEPSRVSQRPFGEVRLTMAARKRPAAAAIVINFRGTNIRFAPSRLPPARTEGNNRKQAAAGRASAATRAGPAGGRHG